MNIGVDHGYYAIKTRHFSFPAGITAYRYEPYTLQNTLEYHHSQGLETYIQKGLVHDEKSAEEYIRNRLLWSLAYTDLLAVRLAYEYVKQEELEKLEELEELLEASRIPAEDVYKRQGWTCPFQWPSASAPRRARGP